MGFSRQEHWSGLPRPPPGDLSGPGIEPMSPMSPALQAGLLPTEHTSPGSSPKHYNVTEHLLRVLFSEALSGDGLEFPNKSVLVTKLFCFPAS